MPGEHDNPQGASTPTTIGSGVRIVGEIRSRDDLHIDGVVEGKIEVDRGLTVGSKASVKAGIKAADVVVIGNVDGNIDATEKIEIRKDARLIGDIRARRIVVEDGAYFKGSIEIVRGEPAPQIRGAGTGT